jgi:Arc/MetJ-type ribon-helix-helix transcriptional regulator
MHTEVMPLRIDKATLSKIDKMVKSGIFKSRNEALNIVIKAGIKNFDFWTDIIKASDNYDEDYDKEVALRLNDALNTFLSERGGY